jgi:hypothetical protein
MSTQIMPPEDRRSPHTRRTMELRVALTPEEHAALTALADGEERTLASFVRSSLRRAGVLPDPDPAKQMKGV